jgi:energy-coupling factor transporter ATP-binding protein EcfA2
MTTIKKIEIKGFFGRGDFEWNLDPEVNILGGKNGSGKSTIFKLCYSLLSNAEINSSLDDHFSNLFENVVLTFNNDWTLRWSKKTDHSGYTLNIGSGEQFSRNDAVSVFNQNGKKVEFGDLQQQVFVRLINSFEQPQSEISQLLKQLSIKKQADPSMLDKMIDREINIRNKDFSSTMENFVDSSTDDGPERSEYVKRYKKIYTTLSHFLQGYDEPFKSSFDFTKKGKTVGIEGLSTGEKQILLLLLMVSNTNQQPCIFFMDEPDLSMHIDWKEILISELHELNPNMQIILSTHAPSVIMQWRDRVKEVGQLTKSA